MKDLDKCVMFPVLSFLLILLVIILLDIGCTFQAPSKPVWEVQFEIPLINRIYTMEEMIEDSDELSVDTLNQEVVFSIEQEIDTALVGEYLNIDGININKEYALGDIDDETLMPDSIVIDSATIKSGNVLVDIHNSNSFSIDVHFELQDLKKDGVFFTIDTTLGPDGDLFHYYDLAGYAFTPPLIIDRNYLRFHAEATGGSIGGFVQINLEVNNVSFSSIRGWLKDVDVAIEEKEQEITIPEEIKGLHVASAYMYTTISNSIQSPGAMNVRIAGTNEDGEEAVVLLTDSIQQASVSESVTRDTTDITSFMNILPTHIQYSDTIKVGKGYSPGASPVEIRENDFVTGTMLIESPLIVKMDPKINQGEVDTVEIEEGTRDAVRDNLKRLSIIAEIENHTPLSAYVSLFFSRTIGDSTLYEQPRASLLSMDSLGLVPATLGVYEISGPDTIWYAEESGINQWEMVLTDEDELTYFQDEEIYLGVQIVFLGTQGKLVKVMPSDFIGLKAHGSVSVLTKIPEDEEEEGGGS